MTTVNEAKVKVDGSWVSLVSDATTTSKGIVQVGDGLSVSNGVISATSQSHTYTIAPSSSSFTLYAGSSVTLVALPPGDSCSGTIRTNWSSAYTGYTLNAICHKTDGTVSVIVLSKGDTTTTIPSGTNTLTINANASAGAGAVNMTVYGLTITRNST